MFGLVNILYHSIAKQRKFKIKSSVELVSGTLLSNRKITMQKPALINLAPRILSDIGISKPDDMDDNPYAAFMIVVFPILL